MVLIGLAVVCGLVAGRLLPAMPRHLGRPYVRGWPLLAAGAVADVVASRLDGGAGTVLLLAGTALLAAFAGANVHLTGMGVLLVGVACNLGAVALNRGMPVRAEALVDADIAEAHELPTVELRGGRHLERDTDLLLWLGDVVPVRPVRAVVSFGDLVVAVGAADVVAHLTRRRTRAPERGARAPVLR